MNPSHPRSRAVRFSWIELIVVMACILLVVAIVVPVVANARRKSDQLACINNVRNLSLAIQMYNNEYREFPAGNLGQELGPFLGLSPGENPYMNDVFLCPSMKTRLLSHEGLTKEDWAYHTYAHYYVARDDAAEGFYFLGCPYHNVVNYAPGKGTQTFTLGTILKDGERWEAWKDGWAKAEDCTLEFSDGSTASVTGTARVLTSFREADGTLYTIIRVFRADGAVTINASVEKGNRFEVVTPAAIAGVAGTEFTVKTDIVPATLPGGADVLTTNVAVTTGKVLVAGREGRLDDGHVDEVYGGDPPTTREASELDAREDPPDEADDGNGGGGGRTPRRRRRRRGWWRRLPWWPWP